MNLFSLSVSLFFLQCIFHTYTYSQHLYQQYTRTHTPPAILCWPLANLFTFCSMLFDIDVKINAFLSLKTLLTTSVDTFWDRKIALYSYIDVNLLTIQTLCCSYKIQALFDRKPHLTETGCVFSSEIDVNWIDTLVFYHMNPMK